MNIYDIPEDLYFYFPLILGSTCKFFNKKINIYDRKIKAIYPPQDFSLIKWENLKKLDISKLSEFNVARILTCKLRLEKLYIGELLYLCETKSAKYKTLCVKKTLYAHNTSIKQLSDLVKKGIKVIIKKVNSSSTAASIIKLQNASEKIKIHSIAIMNMNSEIGTFINKHGLKIAGWSASTNSIKSGIWQKVLERIKKYPDLIIDVSYIDDKYMKDIVDLKNKIICRFVSKIKIEKIKYIESGRIKYVGKNKKITPKQKKQKKNKDPDEYISDSE